MDKIVFKVAKSKDNPLLSSYEESNLMWFTTINELKDIVKGQDTADIIQTITGSSSEDIANKLDILNTIRNDIAHNRIITIESLKTFDKLSNKFLKIIDEFKHRYIHKKDYDIKFNESESDNQAIKYFLNRMEGNN